MNVFQESIMLSFLSRFWSAVAACYRVSCTGRCISGVTGLFKRGFIYALLSYDSRLESVWHKSMFYRAVSRFINLVPNLLSLLYNKIKPASESSWFFRVLGFCGKKTGIFMGLVLFILLIIPYEQWNNLYSLALSVFALCLYYFGSISDRSLRLDLSQFGPWPVLYFTVSCMSLLWSQDFSGSLRFIFFNITCILVLLIFVNSVDSEKLLLRIVEMCALGLLICCMYAVYQRISGIEASSSFTDLDVNANMPGRVFSFFMNPNAFANILVFFTPVMIAMIFFAPGWSEKLYFSAVSMLCCMALAMTYSRGGWLSLAFSAFVLMLLLCPRWLPFFMLLGIFSAPFLPADIRSRLMSIFSSDSSISSRNYIYSAVVRLLEGNWFFGVGLGTSALKRGIAYYGVYKASFPFVHAHNILLQIWAESGMFAAVSFLLSMFFSFKKGFSAFFSRKSGPLRGILSGSIAGLSGAMVFGLTDYAWVFPRVMVLFWFLLAILYSAIKLSRTTHSSLKEGI